MEFITVHEAEEIILAETRSYGIEQLPIGRASGRVLAGTLRADRDLPPFDRATVDGIAIGAEAVARNIKQFTIKGVQAAGMEPIPLSGPDECIEIMTGAAVHHSAVAIVRYEDVELDRPNAQLTGSSPLIGQHIHRMGQDKRVNDVVVPAGRIVDPSLMSIAASLGSSYIPVKKLPRVAVITTGSELVHIDDTPSPFQIRRSNDIAIQAALSRYGIYASAIHLSDDYKKMEACLTSCVQDYDVLLLTGGVSMGRFDYVPDVLSTLGVIKKFHKVKQRPGKPLWFGAFQHGPIVFAFPGNPVSVFMCLHRYFIPWLEESLGLNRPAEYAILQNDICFAPPLQYFPQVSVRISRHGLLEALPVHGNGSGDFANLAETNAFMELPLEHSVFRRGNAYRIWKYITH